MAKHYKEIDREQQFLLQVNMMEWLPRQSFSRLIAAVIDQMEEENPTVYTGLCNLGKGGRMPHSPKMMLGILMLGYFDGETSTRKMVQNCEYDVRYRYHSHNHTPHFTALAKFRRDHEGLFDALIEKTLLVSEDLGMLVAEVLALDGTKVKANAALSANRTAGWIAERLAEYRALCEQTDVREDCLFGADTLGPPPSEALNLDEDMASIVAASSRRVE